MENSVNHGSSWGDIIKFHFLEHRIQVHTLSAGSPGGAPLGLSSLLSPDPRWRRKAPQLARVQSGGWAPKRTVIDVKKKKVTAFSHLSIRKSRQTHGSSFHYSHKARQCHPHTVG